MVTASVPETLGTGLWGNARFPPRPSGLAFALDSYGSILNTTGRAAGAELGRASPWGSEAARWAHGTLGNPMVRYATRL